MTRQQTRLNKHERRLRLEEHFEHVQSTILSRQDPITGLLPASTAVTVHGDYTDAWVRDNVYSVLAVWGLALAYRRQEHDDGKTYLLEQSVVKLMRGLLTCMMKQADKVEAFKHSNNLLDALHAKYDTRSGEPVVADDGWGHLQLDATSLFLLMLAQMTASGLRIVFTEDEVSFVQNLVYYISRTYITPDFGLWERGTKMNEGMAEINVSSVGMAKAALEALRGFDVFAGEGGDNAVIQVVPDDIARARSVLETLLPRESNSKEVDAALLSIIGYPAFAIERTELVERTRAEVVDKLEGRYGCKRFLRDGHQTRVEDHSRLHYEAGELQVFEHIESEWPLFFVYLLIEGLMTGNTEQSQYYQDKLEALFIERDGQRLLPELYYVPADAIEREKQQPGSQERLPNENVPLVWAQSLYILATLLQEQFIHPSDIDPLDRRWHGRKRHDTRINIVVLAQDVTVQGELAGVGLATQTIEQIHPVRVFPARELVRLFGTIGRSDKLGLSGRPPRRLDTLITSQFFTQQGQPMIFLSPLLSAERSYMHLDNLYLIEQLKTELKYIHRHWDQPGRPLLTLLIRPGTLHADHHDTLVEFIKSFQSGEWQGIAVQLAPFNKHLTTIARQRLDKVVEDQSDANQQRQLPLGERVLEQDPELAAPLQARETTGLLLCETQELLQRLRHSRNIYEQMELLGVLWERHDPDQPTELGATLRQLVVEVCQAARRARIWRVLRHAAGLLEWYDERLEDAVVSIVTRQIRLAVGRAYSADMLIDKPLSNSEVMSRIKEYGGDDPRERALIQEIVLLLGVLVRADPSAFSGTLTLQCWHLLLLLNAGLAVEKSVTEDAAFDELLDWNPYKLFQSLHGVILSATDNADSLLKLESLRLASTDTKLRTMEYTPDDDPNPDTDGEGWLTWRRIRGTVGQLPDEFYAQVWVALGHCAGLVIGDRLDSHNRLDSEILRADMTAGEKNFALLVEDRLNHIQAPEYRQLVIEAMQILAHLLQSNEDLKLTSHIVIDVLIGHAVRLAWQDQHAETNYADNTPQAWRFFYELPPHRTANAFVAAFAGLLREQLSTEPKREPV